MGYCDRSKFDCVYTDRDNGNECTLDKCKFQVEIVYKKNGSFKTKPVKINTKIKETTEKKEEQNG